MSNHAVLSAALQAAFAVNEADQVTAADALATVLMAFADAVRGPAPVVSELAVADLAPLPGQAELICEVRALIQEIRADRRHASRVARTVVGEPGVSWVDGAAASGLPG